MTDLYKSKNWLGDYAQKMAFEQQTSAWNLQA